MERNITIIEGKCGVGKSTKVREEIIPELIKSGKQVVLVDVKADKDFLMKLKEKSFILVEINISDYKEKIAVITELIINENMNVAVALPCLFQNLNEFNIDALLESIAALDSDNLAVVIDDANSTIREESRMSIIKNISNLTLVCQEFNAEKLNCEENHIRKIETLYEEKRSSMRKISLEQKMSKANKDGMILVVKARDIPSNVMSEEVTLKGQVIIASAVQNNAESIEENLMALGIIDEFNKNKREVLIDLAIDLLSHAGALEIIEE